jgi:NADH-quinone oxidoreductase subunit E
MSFNVPARLEAELDELLTHYPEKRSASVMVLHALQDQAGFISSAALEWASEKLGLQPIQLLELATFYPMFRQAPAGKFHLKICRTLSCALAGSHQVHAHLCRKLGLDPHRHGLQTTADGRFSVEFVECLASCGTAPTLMCNDESYAQVTLEKVDRLVAACGESKPNNQEKLAAEHGFEP